MQQRKQIMTPKMMQKNIEEMLAGKKSLASVRGISSQTMNACYAAAYNFYNHGRFVDALNIFTRLCMFDNMNAKYWLGLGMTRQMLKDFSGAAEAYGLAATLDQTNPKAPFHAADCLIALKDYNMAKMALEAVISIIEKSKQPKKEYQAMLAQAKNLLELMRKGEKESKESKVWAKVEANKATANKFPVGPKK